MTPAPTPLYSDRSHTLARVIAGAIAAFVGVGLALGARDLSSRPTLASVAAIVAFIALVVGTIRMLTRPQRIFGTAEGLLVETARTTTVVPWSMVGDIECPISSFNPVFRRYYVTVRDEPKRIYFFASRRELDRFEQFRSAAHLRTTSGRTAR
jgi:hypothetical protein